MYNHLGYPFLENQIYSAALYCRLSREDENVISESSSIQNQRRLLTDFVAGQPDITVYDEYIDDGFTGTNFNRPSFQRMLTDIENKKVNCVIVKDLSRFGRDYIDAGYYLDRYFPDAKVRFIALGDGMDTARNDAGMITPFKNVMNHFYTVDISKKVQTSFKVKQKAGEFIGAFTSYGYKKDDADKNHLVIDDYAADVVRDIFRMYLSGVGKIRIAHILNEKGILCPAEYKKACGLKYHNSKKLDSTFYWTYSTIHKILNNEMYLGNMIQGKTYRRMNGRANTVPNDNWIRVEGTHEAIIDQATWDKAQSMLTLNAKDLDFTPSEPLTSRYVNIFCGIIKCGDCGRSMTKTKWSGKVFFTCGSYKRYGMKICTAHTIEQRMLERIILNDLNAIITQVQDIEKMAEEQRAAGKTLVKSEDATARQLAECDARLKILETQRAESYTDYKEGLIPSKESYLAVLSKYAKQEKILLKRKEDLNLELTSVDETNFGVAYSPWITHLLENGYVETLDRETVLEMVECIYVYKDMTVKIVYNFTDELDDFLQRIQIKAAGNQS